MKPAKSNTKSIQQWREALLAANSGGTTELHWALRYDTKVVIPAGVLTKDMLLISDTFGRRPIDFAARYRKLDRIPRELLDIEVLASSKGAKKGPDYWELSRSSGLRPLAIHTAAEYGSLYQIEPQLLIETLLIPTDNSNDFCKYTGLHYAADNGHFCQVPRQLITSENLLLETEDHKTVLHILAKRHSLNEILGTELPDTCKPIVGNDWWETNSQILKSKENLAELDSQEVEIF